jgi:hypothetical protein
MFAELEKQASLLSRKLQAMDEEDHRALDIRWIRRWTPENSRELADMLDRLKSTASEAASRLAKEKGGRGRRHTRTGTHDGWLVRECAHLLRERGQRLPISRAGNLFTVASAVYATATGREPLETLGDKCKRAAGLLRDMDQAEKQGDAERGPRLEDEFDQL